MNETTIRRRDLAGLADHLKQNREALLHNWQGLVDTDPGITTVSTLARAQFVDHIPQILEAFEKELRAYGAAPAATANVREGAAEHGVHRWLHGYHYRETMREWGHLQVCLSAEVERFALSRPDLDAHAMSFGRQLLTRLFSDCMVESAACHVRLAEMEAASRLRDLEQVLSDLRRLEKERAELWREAAHDLRGNVGAVQLAATSLARGVVAAQPAATVAYKVERTAQALTLLLDDLIALARLEAGREHRYIVDFDAVLRVREMCQNFESAAEERGLFLKFTAPEVLPVHGDPVKLGRIVQNLLINAFKYTERGGVCVTVAEAKVGSVPSWELRVEDTGVGIDDRSSSAIVRLLRSATRETKAVEETASSEPDSRMAVLPSASPRTAPLNEARGEGVGLTIVKRLCELLDATIEMDTGPGKGTTFRLIFPCRYDSGEGAADRKEGV